MDQTYIRDLARHVGEEVTLKGWIYNIRSSGKLKVPQIRDGSGIIQGVVSKRDVSEAVWSDFDRLTQESSVIVRGNVREHPKQPGVFELDVHGLEVLQVAQEYPIT